MNEQIINFMEGASLVKPIKRTYNHYGMYFNSFINVGKLYNYYHKYGEENENVEKLVMFIWKYIINKEVPDQEFTNDKNRCSSMAHIDMLTVEKSSRHEKLIKKALFKKEDREAHFVVLRELVRHPDTGIFACEIPVWTDNFHTVGHVDCLELLNGNPFLFVWDYKPQLHVSEKWTGQVMMDRILLSDLTDVPMYEIGGGAFNQVMEEIMVE